MSHEHIERRSFLQAAAAAAILGSACSDPTAPTGTEKEISNAIQLTGNGDILAQPESGLFLVERTQDFPTSVTVTNKSPGTKCQAEIRISNGVGGGDLFISGTGYTDGSNFAPNEVGLVAESTAAGLHLRSNGDTYVRLSVGQGPVEMLRLTQHGLQIHDRPVVPTGAPVDGAGLLYAEGGALKWRSPAGTVTIIAPA